MKTVIKAVAFLLICTAAHKVMAALHFEHTFESDEALTINGTPQVFSWNVGDSVDRNFGASSGPPLMLWQVRNGMAVIGANDQPRPSKQDNPAKNQVLKLIGGSQPAVEVMRLNHENQNGAQFIDFHILPVAEPFAKPLSSVHIGGVHLAFVEESIESSVPSGTNGEMNTKKVPTGYGTVLVEDFHNNQSEWRPTGWKFTMTPGTRQARWWMRVTIYCDHTSSGENIGGESVDVSIDGVMVAPRIRPAQGESPASQSIFFGSESAHDVMIDDLSAGDSNPLPVPDTDADGLPDSWEQSQDITAENKLAEISPGKLNSQGATWAENYSASLVAIRRAAGDDTILDTDNDGMPDYWEQAFLPWATDMPGLNPLVNDADKDLDRDGLTNGEEFLLGTTPLSFPLYEAQSLSNSLIGLKGHSVKAVREVSPGEVWLAVVGSTNSGLISSRLVHLRGGQSPAIHSVNLSPNVSVPEIVGIENDGTVCGNCWVTVNGLSKQAAFFLRTDGYLWIASGGTDVVKTRVTGTDGKGNYIGTVTKTDPLNNPIRYCLFKPGTNESPADIIEEIPVSLLSPVTHQISGVTSDGWVYGTRISPAPNLMWCLQLSKMPMSLITLNSPSAYAEYGRALNALSDLNTFGPWICGRTGSSKPLIWSPREPEPYLHELPALPVGSSYSGCILSYGMNSVIPLRAVSYYKQGKNFSFLNPENTSNGLGAAIPCLTENPGGSFYLGKIGSASEVIGRAQTIQGTLELSISVFGKTRKLRELIRNADASNYSDINHISFNGDLIASATQGNESFIRQILFKADTDGDGMSDEFETKYGLWKYDGSERTYDPDRDGLVNSEEYIAGTDPGKRDSDGDGMPDGWERSNNLDATDASDKEKDYDDDRLTNLQEYLNDSNPFTPLEFTGDGTEIALQAYDIYVTDMADSGDGNDSVKLTGYVDDSCFVYDGQNFNYLNLSQIRGLLDIGVYGEGISWSGYSEPQVLGFTGDLLAYNQEFSEEGGTMIAGLPSGSFLGCGIDGVPRLTLYDAEMPLTYTPMGLPGALYSSFVAGTEVKWDSEEYDTVLAGAAFTRINGYYETTGFVSWNNTRFNQFRIPGGGYFNIAAINRNGRLIAQGSNSFSCFAWENNVLQQLDVDATNIIDMNDAGDMIYRDSSGAFSLWRNGKGIPLSRLLRTGSGSPMTAAEAAQIQDVCAISNSGKIAVIGISPDNPSNRAVFILQYATDHNKDGLPDDWEKFYWEQGAGYEGFGEVDSDNDGLNNFKEFDLGTDPRDNDTDGDGRTDGAEHAAGSDPLKMDPPRLADELVISEVCPAPEHAYINGLGINSMEWVEFYLPDSAKTDEAGRDLSIYRIDYKKGASDSTLSRRFPVGTILRPGERLIVNFCDPSDYNQPWPSLYSEFIIRLANYPDLFFPKKISKIQGRLKLMKDTGGLFQEIQSINLESFSASLLGRTYRTLGYDLVSDDLKVCAEPSPGKPNVFVPSLWRIDQENSFPASGVYAVPVQLIIPANENFQYVLWTDDGSEPLLTNGNTRVAHAGESLPEITRTTVLRLRGYRGRAVSEPVTRTYIFPQDILWQQNPPGITGNNARRVLYGQGDAPDMPVPFRFDADQLFRDETTLLPGGAASPGAGAALSELATPGLNGNLPIVSIISDSAGLFGEERGIYTNSTQRGDDWVRSASVEFIGAGQPGSTTCQVEISGRASTQPGVTRKHSLRLRWKAENGLTALNASGLFEGFQKPGLSAFEQQNEFDSLVLKSPAFDTWATQDIQRTRAVHSRQAWLHGTMRAINYKEHGALPPQPRSRMVHLFLNGLYWGIYSLGEEPDADFLKRSWEASTSGASLSEEDFDVIEDGFVASGTGKAWNDLLAASFMLRRGDVRADFDETAIYSGDSLTMHDRFEAVKALLDVNQFIDYVLVNLFLENRDWPESNWVACRVNRDGATDRRWRFIARDSEVIAGLGVIRQWEVRNGNATLVVPDYHLERFFNNQAANGIAALFHNLCASAEFRSKLVERMNAADISNSFVTKYLFGTPGSDPLSADYFVNQLALALAPARAGSLLEAARWAGGGYSLGRTCRFDFETEASRLAGWRSQIFNEIREYANSTVTQGKLHFLLGLGQMAENGWSPGTTDSYDSLVPMPFTVGTAPEAVQYKGSPNSNGLNPQTRILRQWRHTGVVEVHPYGAGLLRVAVKDTLSGGWKEIAVVHAGSPQPFISFEVFVYELSDGTILAPDKLIRIQPEYSPGTAEVFDDDSGKIFMFLDANPNSPAFWMPPAPKSVDPAEMGLATRREMSSMVETSGPTVFGELNYLYLYVPRKSDGTGELKIQTETENPWNGWWRPGYGRYDMEKQQALESPFSKHEHGQIYGIGTSVSLRAANVEGAIRPGGTLDSAVSNRNFNSFEPDDLIGSLIDPNAISGQRLEDIHTRYALLWKHVVHAQASGRLSGTYTWVESVLNHYGPDVIKNLDHDELLDNANNNSELGRTVLGVPMRDYGRWLNDWKDVVRETLDGEQRHGRNNFYGWMLSAQGKNWTNDPWRGFGTPMDSISNLNWFGWGGGNSVIPGRFDRYALNVNNGEGFHTLWTGMDFFVHGVRRWIFPDGQAATRVAQEYLNPNKAAQYKMSVQVLVPDLAGGYAAARYGLSPFYPGVPTGGVVASHNIVLTESAATIDSKAGSLPLRDQSGFRFRQVGLNGRPAPGSKEQTAAESDETPEEAHIDSLTLQLRYDTSDVYVPTPGGELALSVRRSAQPELWSDKGGNTPFDQVPGEFPFGPGWSTGLGCHLHIDQGADGEIPSGGDGDPLTPDPIPERQPDKTTQDRVTIVDENGQRHQFYTATVPAATASSLDSSEIERVFIPVVSDRNDIDSWLNQLTIKSGTDGSKWFEFQRKFGTKIKFPLTDAPLAKWRESQPGKFRLHQYYRADIVEDRFGSFLRYEFDPANHTLVPNRIASGWPRQPEGLGLRKIHIEVGNEGRVLSVTDPAGNAPQRYYYGAEVKRWDQGADAWVAAPVPAQAILAQVTSPLGHQVVYSYSYAADDGSIPGPDGIWRRDPSLQAGQLPNYSHLNLASITSRDSKVSRVFSASANTSPSERTTRISYDWDQAIRLMGMEEDGTFRPYDPAVSKPRVVTGIEVEGIKGTEVNRRITAFRQRFISDGFPNSGACISTSPVPLTNRVEITPAAGTLGVTGQRVVEVLDGSGSNWFYVYSEPLFCDGREIPDLLEGNLTGKTLDPVVRWRKCTLYYPLLTTSGVTPGSTYRMRDTAEFDAFAGMADKVVMDASGNRTEYEYSDPIEYELIQPWFRPLQRLLELRDNASASALRDKLINNLASSGAPTRFFSPRHSDPTRETRYLRTHAGPWVEPANGVSGDLINSTKIIKDFRYYSSPGTGSAGSPYRNTVISTAGLPSRIDRLRSPLARVMVESQGPYRVPAASDDHESIFAVTILDHNKGVPVRSATVGWGRNSSGVPAANQILSDTVSEYNYTTFPVFLSRQTVRNAIWNNGNLSDQVTTYSPGPYGNVQNVTTQVLAVSPPSQIPSLQQATVTTQVDANGNRMHVTDAMGYTTSFIYDAQNRLIGTENPTDAVTPASSTQAEFDNMGRKVWARDEEGVQSWRIFGANGKLEKTILDLDGNGVAGSLGDTVTKNEYDAYGRLVAVTDPMGTVTRTVYDSLHRPRKVFTDLNNNGVWEHDPASSNYEPGLENFYESNAGTSGQTDENAGSGAFASSSWQPTKVIEYRRARTMTGWQEQTFESKTTYDSLYRTVKSEKQAVASSAERLTTTTVYDLAGRATLVKSPHGQNAHVEYDGLGRPLKQWTSVDAGAFSGAPVGTFYTSVSVTFPVTEHFYSAGAEYRTTFSADTETTTTETDYDIAGRPACVWSPDPASGAVNRTIPAGDDFAGSPAVRTLYDLNGRAVLTISPLGLVSGYPVFDARGRVIRAVGIPMRDASGLAAAPAAPSRNSLPLVTPQSSTLYFRNGWTAETLDARGLRTKFQYDRAGRVVKTVSGPSSGSTVLSSEPWRTPFVLANAPALDANGEALVTMTASIYDRNGNVLAARDASGSVTLNRYDPFNRLLKTCTNPSSDPVAGLQSYFDPSLYTGALVPALPSLAGNIIVANTYDSAGNLVEVEDGAHQFTRFLYDGANRKTHTIWDPNESGRRRQEQTRYYGALAYSVEKSDEEIVTTVRDRMLRTIGSNFSHHSGDSSFMQLDKWGRVLQVTYPMDNRNSAQSQLRLSSMRYDRAGRVIAEITGGGQTRYRYDRAGQVREVQYGHLGSQGIDSVWLAQADIHRRVISTYDSSGRLETITESGPGPAQSFHETSTRTTDYYYSAAGDVVRKSVPGGQFTRNTYDTRGRLTETATYVVQGAGPAYTVAPVNSSSSRYLAAGPVRQVIEKKGATIIRWVTNSYDSTWRLLTETDQSASGPEIITRWEYDMANNRTLQRKFHPGQEAAPLSNWIYTFNRPGPGFSADGANSNQIVMSRETVANVETYYNYDYNGNRQWEETYYWNNYYDGEIAYEFRYYTYDGSNRLIEAYYDSSDAALSDDSVVSQRSCYDYDYRTRRVFRSQTSRNGIDPITYQPLSSSVEAFQCVFSGGLSVQEYGLESAEASGLYWDIAYPPYGNGRPAAEFILGSAWGGGVGGILYTLRSDQGLRVNTYNHRGDVIGQTSGNGTATLAWSTAYDAFGKRLDGTTPGQNDYENGQTADRHRANTHEEDPTGLINDGYRYRDPLTGTYLTRDPAGFVDGPNVYCYVRQNPWSSFDAHGLSALDTFCGACGAVWGAVTTAADIVNPYSTKRFEIARKLIAETPRAITRIQQQQATLEKEVPSSSATNALLRCLPGMALVENPAATLFNVSIEGSRMTGAMNVIEANENARLTLNSNGELDAVGFANESERDNYRGQGYGMLVLNTAAPFLTKGSPTRVRLLTEEMQQQSLNELYRTTFTEGGTRTSWGGGGSTFTQSTGGEFSGFAAKTTAAPTGQFYSTAFETTLAPTSYPGVSRYMHFKEANTALDAAIRADAGVAASMERLGISVPRSSSGSIIGKSPENWVWHHDTQAGVMQLVPKSQHPNIPGGIFWETMHPGGNGGFSIWGK